MSSTRGPSPIHTVLVVDDVEVVRHLTRRLLEAAGYRVLEAKDGVDALSQMAHQQVGLVLTDLRMPNMDGWELAAHLAGRSPRMPVVFMSGYDEHLGSESLLGPVLPKPFTAEQLYRRVRQMLSTPQAATGA